MIQLFTQLPDRWKVTRVDRVATVNARIGWKALTAAEYQPEGYAFLATPNIKSDDIDFENVNYIPKHRYDESPELKLSVGDVLLTKDGNTLGITNLVRHLPRPATVNGSIAVLRPFDVHPDFLRYVLASDATQQSIAALKGGMGVPHLFQWDINRLPVPLPPLDEQRRIADFLDGTLAQSVRLTDSLNAALGLLDERDSSSMAHAFTALSLSGRHFDEKWTLPLRRVVARWIDYRGATPTKTMSGVPLVTAKNIKGGRVDLALAPEFIAEDDYDEWMRRGLPDVGDVLLTTEAPLGEVARIVDPNIALAQRVILMKVARSVVNPEWIYWYFRSPIGQAELFARATGSTALGIKADRLRAVPVPIFGWTEMDARLSWLSARIEETAQLRAPIKRQLALLAERQQALITAAVTGQLDVATARGVNE